LSAVRYHTGMIKSFLTKDLPFQSSSYVMIWSVYVQMIIFSSCIYWSSCKLSSPDWKS